MSYAKLLYGVNGPNAGLPACNTGCTTGKARLDVRFSSVVIKALYTLGVRNNPHSPTIKIADVIKSKL